MNARDNWLVRDKDGKCFVSTDDTDFRIGEFRFANASILTEDEARQIMRKYRDAVHTQHIG